MKHLLLLITVLCNLCRSVEAFWIIGGHEAKPHSRPYMASVQNRNGHVCGGAVINRKWVLTAAHCMLPIASLRVVLGAHKFSAPDKYVKVFSVLKSIPHPNFNKQTFENDILLLKLNDSVGFNTAVSPISLPCRGSNVRPGSTCSVAGWGYVSNLPIAPAALMETDVNIISLETCKKVYGYIPPSMICSASQGKIKGVCSVSKTRHSPLECHNVFTPHYSYCVKQIDLYFFFCRVTLEDLLCSKTVWKVWCLFLEKIVEILKRLMCTHVFHIICLGYKAL
uniref:Peptidase S1 domain-containing protein n=1 Tax=Leptobrachium leishanense TaxID=445787 RepID=A0A8C5QN71_9ANUR